MRLRSTVMLVFICAGVALAGAWTDRTKVSVDPGNGAVPAAKPWETIIEISRHGRRLDGFRPVMTVTGLSNPRTFHADAMPDGRYKVEVVFPSAGFYQYTVKVADRVAAHGQVYAIPR